jgi:hypothetical protein
MPYIDPTQVKFNLGVPITGFAPGSYITATPMSVTFESQAGIDGETQRVKKGDRRWQFKLTLLRSSASNDVLSALHLQDVKGNNGAGVAPLIMTDMSGRTKFAAPEAWIVGWPEADHSDEPGQTREWTVEAANVEVFIGGH